MDTLFYNLKKILILSGGVLGWFLGGFDSLAYTLVIFVTVDYVTGLLLAIYERKVSSKMGFRGISKKVLIFVLVALGNFFDQFIIGSGSPLRTMLIMFYLSNEGISILENSAKMGVPFPQKIKNFLMQIGDTNKN